MKKVEQVDALILRSYPSGDYDLVYRLLSPNKGKFTAIAKSVRKSKKRFSSMPEPFDIGEAEIRRGRGDLYLFGGFVSKRNFLPLRESLDHFSYGCVICECFDRLIPEETEEHWEELYSAATDGLEAVSNSGVEVSGAGPIAPAIRTLRKLLRLSGFLQDDFTEHDAPLKLQWQMLVDRIEQIVERPLQSRLAFTESSHA